MKCCCWCSLKLPHVSPCDVCMQATSPTSTRRWAPTGRRPSTKRSWRWSRASTRPTRSKVTCAPPCFGFMSAHPSSVSFTTCAMCRWSVWGDDGGGARQRRARHAADRFSRQVVVVEEAHTQPGSRRCVVVGGEHKLRKKHPHHHDRVQKSKRGVVVVFTCVCVCWKERTPFLLAQRGGGTGP